MINKNNWVSMSILLLGQYTWDWGIIYGRWTEFTSQFCLGLIQSSYHPQKQLPSLWFCLKSSLKPTD